MDSTKKLEKAEGETTRRKKGVMSEGKEKDLTKERRPAELHILIRRE